MLSAALLPALLLMSPCPLRAEPDPASRVQAALAFLRSRIGPRGLIDSYVEDNTDYSYTYDDALAAMAFISAGDMNSARKILDAFQTIKAEPEGGFLHRYHANNGQNAAGILQTGANTYLLQAMNLYYSRTGDRRYNELAQRIANYLCRLQDSDGGLFGGSQISWKSSENNIGALSAFHNIATAQNSTYYTERADRIYIFLAIHCWDGTRFLEGKNNHGGVTDAQALGAIIMGPRYANGAFWAEEHTLMTKRIDQQSVTGFGFDEESNTIWTEGTLQMSLAFLVAGNQVKSDTYKAEAEKLIHPSGALLLACNPGTAGPKWEVKPWQAVAPTAWYVFVSNRDNVFEMR